MAGAFVRSPAIVFRRGPWRSRAPASSGACSSCDCRLDLGHPRRPGLASRGRGSAATAAPRDDGLRGVVAARNAADRPTAVPHPAGGDDRACGGGAARAVRRCGWTSRHCPGSSGEYRDGSDARHGAGGPEPGPAHVDGGPDRMDVDRPRDRRGAHGARLEPRGARVLGARPVRSTLAPRGPAAPPGRGAILPTPIRASGMGRDVLAISPPPRSRGISSPRATSRSAVLTSCPGRRPGCIRAFPHVNC